MRDLMSTKEVAEYLRLKERKIYDLVSRSAIPTSRISGKLLFPREQIDAWVREKTSGRNNIPLLRSPAVLAGSHDPLLDWAVRESRCGLATLCYGSLDGLERMVSGEASAAAIHLPPSHGSGRNISVSQEKLGKHDVALVAWAEREQGLVLAAGNPLKLESLEDVRRRKARVMLRQPQAGSYLLFLELLGAEGMALNDLKVVKQTAQTESEIAAAILDNKADVGLAVRSVSRQFHLGFHPLAVERLDLLVSRRAYFEPPLQRLFEFARTKTFSDYARALSGYSVTDLGKVLWSA
jgi:putative molybdopterin biosynthesis protein